MALYNDLLNKIGLDEKEVEVYETLLTTGQVGMGKLLPRLSLKRGSAYNAVYGLIKRGLAVEREVSGRKVFELTNPDQLFEVLQSSASALKQTEQQLGSVLPDLKSAYNLIMHRPNVRFFEGEAGVAKVREDSLTATEEIYSYIDNEIVRQFLKSENTSYVKQRQNQKLKKKMLTLDNPFVRQHAKEYQNAWTELRVIGQLSEHFATTMQIYDNKVTYITYRPEFQLGVIIEDANIYRMHRLFFEELWKVAKPPVSAPSPSPVPTTPVL